MPEICRLWHHHSVLRPAVAALPPNTKEMEALFDVRTLELLEGCAAPPAAGLFTEWALGTARSYC
jgi:hypothetical protein